MRDRDNPETIFDELAARGLVNVGTLEDQLDRIADTVALEEQHGTDSIVIAPTNAAAGRINHAVFERLADASVLDTSTIAHGRDGDPIAAGVRIATRQNDRELGVAKVFCLTFETEFFGRHGFVEIEGTPVDHDVFEQLLRSYDEGVAEFLDLERVKPNTLGNTRMLLTL